MTAWRKLSWGHANGNCAEVGWRKSARCQAGECVEAGNGTRVVLVRDTTDRGGTVLSFTAGAWAEFTAGLSDGAR